MKLKELLRYIDTIEHKYGIKIQNSYVEKMNSELALTEVKVTWKEFEEKDNKNLGYGWRNYYVNDKIVLSRFIHDIYPITDICSYGEKLFVPLFKEYCKVISEDPYFGQIN